MVDAVHSVNAVTVTPGGTVVIVDVGELVKRVTKGASSRLDPLVVIVSIPVMDGCVTVNKSPSGS